MASGLFLLACSEETASSSSDGSTYEPSCTCPDASTCDACPECEPCVCPDAGSPDSATDASEEAEASTGEVCDDGVDNDEDGDVDCADADCAGQRCQSWCDQGEWHAVMCENGSCTSAETVTSCVDLDVCTDNGCDDRLGCQKTYNEAPCSDGRACTWGDSCASGACTGILVPEWREGTIRNVICAVGDCTEAASYSKAQEFVAPHDRIGHVEVEMLSGTTQPIELRILSDLPDPGSVAGTVDQTDLTAKTLGTATIHPTTSGQVHAYFSPQVSVTAGDKYYLFMEDSAAVMQNPNAHWMWNDDPNDSTSGPYKDGRMFILWDTTSWSEEPSKDWTFHVHCDVDRYLMVDCDAGQFDPNTQLCWQSPGDTTSMLLGNATNYCETLGEGGHDDWRLPTVDELRSLLRGCEETETGGACAVVDGSTTAVFVAEDCNGCGYLAGPRIDGCYWDEAMDEGCGSLWSSSSAGTGTWVVDMRRAKIDAYVGNPTHQVRCVRDVVYP